MKLLDLFRLALRSLWRRKLRSALTILSVMVGAMAVIALVSLALGAQNVFLQTFESFGLLNQVQVMPLTDVQEVESNGGPFGGGGFGGGGNGELAEGARALDEDMIKDLEAIPHVVSVSPSISVYTVDSIGFSETDSKYNAGVSSEALELIEYTEVPYGRAFSSDDEANVVILPYSYVEEFGYGEDPEGFLGKTVELGHWQGFYGVDHELPSWEDMGPDSQDVLNISEAEVIGIMSSEDSGPTGRSGGLVLVSVGWAEDLMKRREWDWEAADEERERLEAEGVYKNVEPEEVLQTELENGYQSIVLEVDDTQYVEEVADAAGELSVTTFTSKEILDQILQVFTIIEIVLGAIGAISLFVASIGIVNTMVMAIYERTKEIGLMKAVGATKLSIWKLFTAEASFLGFWGGVAGVAFGYGLATLANEIANRYMSDSGIAATDIVSLPWWLIVGMIVFTTVIGTLAGLYPAAKAARLDPIDALWRE